jgi:Cdc6-like AAA superfamily ATPase
LSKYAWEEKIPRYNDETFGKESSEGIFQDPDFRRCLSKDKGFTFILHGKPGAGKTATISYLSQHVHEAIEVYSPIMHDEETKCDGSEAPLTVASVYLKFNDTSQSEYGSILLSFLYQLTDAAPGSDDLVDELIRKSKHGRQPLAKDVSEILVSILNRTRPTCLFIDALDEYDDNARYDLLASLSDLQSKTEVGLVLTSRTGVGDWERHFTHYELYELKAHPCDIETYLKHELKKCKAKWARNQEYCKKVVNTIVKASSGM